MGIVFQSYNLFPHLTVAENIALAPRHSKGKTRAEARELTERVQKMKASIRAKVEHPFRPAPARVAF